MNFLKKIYEIFVFPFKFINEHFKAMLFLLLLVLLFGDVSKDPLKKPNLVSINLHGAIEDTSEVMEKIQNAKEDENIKGVLLHVNSPGGALAPSVELSLAVKELNKIKPVVAYAGGSMTSGSYYASIWSEKIFANPGAFIGSIGVIFQAPNIQELAKKLGIKEQVVKAGEYKEAGTFTREWTPKERESLNEMINDAYELFVSDVAKARNLEVEKKDTFANARVFLAHKAQKVGLIDKVGSLTLAQEYLKTASGVQEAIWQKPDPFEKAMQRLANEGVSSLLSAFYGLKAY